ncbi:MAG: DNA alkylation repair protein [Patescibacteria group bacterium]|nr:DNA alkylation repair protein [Patescibacteria group bacterium]MDD5716043.1 DNA alkylation repair protein [Patescibacteria group bacterium]
MSQLAQLNNKLQSLGSLAKAKILQRFFKTGPGEYGEGDVFLGITVPVSRQIALKYKTLPFADIAKLISSKYHEARLVALLILVHNFKKGDGAVQEKIFSFYLAHTRYINNWDLVDLSAHEIVGGFLLYKPRGILLKLARSSNLWERRIAMMATFEFIKHGQAKDTLTIAKLLLHDKHDLIHKVVGWMLREVGKRVSLDAERQFLGTYALRMPRTMLRYAIERFPEPERRKYLLLQVE